ncbi:MAG: SRPBCC family protein [Gammaproteobacteria bacterium]|nr:SRPBCC family protein [Gammaproteobacteria bacterium]
MKIVKRVALAAVAVVIILLIVSVFLPSKWTVERTVHIAAPAAAVFPYINSLKQWPAWTVWYEREPDLRVSYDGPEAGVGAISRWAGKDGEGEMTVTASEQDKAVSYDLVFNNGEFRVRGVLRLAERDGGTAVTWTSDGDVGRNPVGRYFALFMDRWMGRDFEHSLATLKKTLEKPR